MAACALVRGHALGSCVIKLTSLTLRQGRSGEGRVGGGGEQGRQKPSNLDGLNKGSGTVGHVLGALHKVSLGNGVGGFGGGQATGVAER